jgi:hypothetical protein
MVLGLRRAPTRPPTDDTASFKAHRRSHSAVILRTVDGADWSTRATGATLSLTWFRFNAECRVLMARRFTIGVCTGRDLGFKGESVHGSYTLKPGRFGRSLRLQGLRHNRNRTKGIDPTRWPHCPVANVASRNRT